MHRGMETATTKIELAMGKNMKNNKAFTLTEVIAVAAVIVVLAVVWAFYGRGHVKVAMMNEGRLFVDKIIAQERNYLSEHGSFKTEGSYTRYSKDLYIDARDNKYFSTFKIATSGSNVTVFLKSVYDKDNDAMVATYLGASNSITFATEDISKMQ